MIVLGYSLAVVIGISLGLLGGGGAILTVPVLVYVLGVGVKEAVPMSLIVVGLTSLVGAVHSRGHNLNRRAVLIFGPAAALGSVLGTVLALRMSARLQLTILAVVLILAAFSMLRSADRAELDRPPAARPAGLLAGIGGGVGLLTGLIGIGGGFLYVPALVLLGGLEMRQAVGTSLALITLSCAAGIAGYIGRISLEWQMVALFTGLAFVGVRIGTALGPKFSQAALRRGFAGLLVVMGVLVLIRR